MLQKIDLNAIAKIECKRIEMNWVKSNNVKLGSTERNEK